jgi:hypothetical protein
MIEETINKFIRDMINLILESPDFAIKAKQKGARKPKQAFADVDIISTSLLSWEEIKYTNRVEDDDLDWQSSSSNEIVVSVGFHKDNAADNAKKVHQGLIRESVQSLFRQGNLALIRRSEVRDVSNTLENGWEDRSQFDIFLNVVRTDSDIVKSIMSLDIASEFQSRGLTYNFNIEV